MCCFTYNSVFALSGPPTVQNQNISRSSLGGSWQPDSNTISLRQEARIDQDSSRCRWRQRWEWCAWSPAWSTWQTSSSASHRFSSWKQTIHYHSLFFSLSQRRKFLDDRGYWTVLPWFFHTEKAEINISALILKDYPHSTVNLRSLALSRPTKDRE